MLALVFCFVLCFITPNYSLTTTNVGSSYTRYTQFINTLTSLVGGARAVHSSGGAAGGVVSEGQGYGILIGAATASALGSSNANYRNVVQQTYEMYLGWKRMCTLSVGSASCQNPGYCAGSIPCLPHWKFSDNLGSSLGTGPATDGDADAITGLIMLTRLTKTGGYTWWNEVAKFAFQSCRQFMDHETAVSGSYRITKLGACWGGWDCNNPSYLAPAMYRSCRNYMKDYSSTLGYGTQGTDYVSKWNTLISTTYDVLDAAQCDSTGLTPNWYVPNAASPKTQGSTACSGSGTPSGQYGAEAARGVWRVALDYIWYPESATRSGAYLDAVSKHLMRKFSGSSFGALDVGCLVNSVFANWYNEQFMFGPTLTALVKQVSGGTSQQAALNTAGSKVGSSAISSYYGGSWIVISTLTLSGDFAKSASLMGGAAPAPTAAPPPTAPAPTVRPPPPTVATPTSCVKRRIFGTNSWDSLFSGTWSWGSYSLSDSYIRYAGYNTLSIKMANFNALQLRCNNNCISTSQYKGIEFVTRSSANSRTFRVRMRAGDLEVGSNSIQTATTTWTKKTILFSSFAPGITSFNVLQLQDNGNNSADSVYFDEIYLIPNSC